MRLLRDPDSLSGFDVLKQVSFRQVLVDLVIGRELREVVVVVGRPAAEDEVVEVLLAEFVLGHDPPQQMMVLNDPSGTSSSGL